MLLEIWHTYLYQPTFNLLIWIYNNWTDQNLGWAIVYLTCLLRAALLPFTLLNEKANVDNADIGDEILRLEKELANEPELKKEEIRRLLKTKKVHPWSKVMVLGIQALVLVLLYQVFLQGITGEKIMQILYPVVNFPGKMNTIFFGFDLGVSHDIYWSGAVMLILMAEIYSGLKVKNTPLNKADLTYFVLMPVSVFVVLFWLPMVKSLFILTSIVFSFIVHQISKLLFKPKDKKVKSPS